MKSLHRALLNDARKGKGQEILIVRAILKPNVVSVLETLDHGDGDGIRYIDEFVEEVILTGLLKPGESIERVLVRPKTLVRVKA